MLVTVALATAACSSGHHAPPQAQPSSKSLAILGHPTAAQSDFGVVLDAKTGRALAAFRVNKPIRAAVPDGNGGWYIGGGFIHVNGALRKRLAHVDANGVLDPRWKPEANGNGVSVASLARIGSRLYVGGDFAKLERQPRLWVGAVDAATGKLLRWQPARASVDYPVLLPGRGRLYLAGYAVTGGSGLVALDPETGRLKPDWRGDVDTSNIEGGSVRFLALHGGRLYFGGMFGKVDGKTIPGLAAVDADDGTLLPRWQPKLRARYCVVCTDVTALATDRNHVVAGTRNGVLSLDPETGAVERPFGAHIGLTNGTYGGTEIASMARSGERLYIAGTFDSVDGARRRGFGAVDATTGRVVPSWTPNATQAAGSVVVRSGSRLLLGIELRRAVNSGR